MQPTIVERAEQPYVGRRESITMTQSARVADHLPTMFARLGEVWGCRLEVLLTDPAEQPDRHKWRTDLFFELAD